MLAKFVFHFPNTVNWRKGGITKHEDPVTRGVGFLNTVYSPIEWADSQPVQSQSFLHFPRNMINVTYRIMCQDDLVKLFIEQC